MEPEVRFCRSNDGTNIAYTSYGAPSAATLFDASPWTTSDEFDWARPERRAWCEILAAKGIRSITFDRRGVGASDRNASDISLASQVADLAAVADHLQLERFHLIGWDEGAAVTVAYAAKHVERVSRLILDSAFVRGTDKYRQTAAKGVADLMRADWPTARTMLAAILYPTIPDLQRSYSRMLRDSMSPEVAARYVEYLSTIDLAEYLQLVEAPTLVLQDHAVGRSPLSVGRAVAAAIPNARFVPIKAGVTDPMIKLQIILDFLTDGRSPQLRIARPAGDVITMLFTDLASSTALTQRLGDANAQALVRAHNTIVREALAAQDGTEIKHTGDGIMASFQTASTALECAIAVQRGVAAHNDANLQVHIGLNAGEPVAEESDLFGTSVQLARRICDRAEAAQILASNVVRELAAGKGFLFSDIGEVMPKGFEEPVRLYEVRWRD